MPTAVENKYVFAKLDELEPAARLAPGATDDGRKRFDVRRNLDITAFGVSAFSAPSGVTVINEHDETLLGEAGQEELYIVTERRGDVRDRRRDGRGSDGRPRQRAADGEAEGDGDRRRHDDPRRRRHPPARRTSPLRRKPRRHSPRTAQATTKRRSRSSSSSSRSSRTIPWRTSTSGASRRGPDTLTRRSRHLGRAVEINDRIKELIATDEDLDSIREDPRFVELAK